MVVCIEQRQVCVAPSEVEKGSSTQRWVADTSRTVAVRSIKSKVNSIKRNAAAAFAADRGRTICGSSGG